MTDLIWGSDWVMSDGPSVNSLQLKWMTETLSVSGRAMNEPLISMIFLKQISKAFCSTQGKCYGVDSQPWLQPLTYSGDVTHGVSITVSLYSHEREMNLIKSFIKAAGVYICTTLVRLSIVYYITICFYILDYNI